MSAVDRNGLHIRINRMNRAMTELAALLDVEGVAEGVGLRDLEWADAELKATVGQLRAAIQKHYDGVASRPAKAPRRAADATEGER